MLRISGVQTLEVAKFVAKNGFGIAFNFDRKSPKFIEPSKLIKILENKLSSRKTNAWVCAEGTITKDTSPVVIQREKYTTKKKQYEHKEKISLICNVDCKWSYFNFF